MGSSIVKEKFAREMAKEPKHSLLYRSFCLTHHLSILSLIAWFVSMGPQHWPSPLSFAIWWVYSDMYRYNVVSFELFLFTYVNTMSSRPQCYPALCLGRPESSQRSFNRIGRKRIPRTPPFPDGIYVRQRTLPTVFRYSSSAVGLYHYCVSVELKT